MAIDTLVLQLDALMAVAHDIPTLHRKEHPGDGTNGLGADDFLPIFIYVLVNSRVEDLAVQSVVLETLCDPKKMMGEAGQSLGQARTSATEDSKRAAQSRARVERSPPGCGFGVWEALTKFSEMSSTAAFRAFPGGRKYAWCRGCVRCKPLLVTLCMRWQRFFPLTCLPCLSACPFAFA